METNVGTADRKVRTGLGAIAGIVSLAILANVLALPGIAALVLGVVALVLLGTAATGTCGLYSVIGVSTCPRKDTQ